jgi:hypothetical protein
MNSSSAELVTPLVCSLSHINVDGGLSDGYAFDNDCSASLLKRNQMLARRLGNVGSEGSLLLILRR